MTYRSLTAIIFVLCIISAVVTYAATVTVDIPKSSVVCDSTAFSAKINKIAGSQVSLHVASDSPSPRSFTLKINGLQPGDQDWYVNGDYKGKKPDSAFVTGVALSIPGRGVSPELFRCIACVRDRVNAGYDAIKGNKETEHVRAANTLSQAQDWVTVAEKTDASARSKDVVVAPADVALVVKSGLNLKTPEDAQNTYINMCHLLQQARDRMFDNIKDPALRNQTVVALTPIDLQLSYYTVNGRAKGTATVVNNTNIPISGKVTPVAPAGWKVTAKTLGFKGLPSGKSFKADFALVPPKGGGALPASLRAQAAMTLGYEPFWASFTLTADAAKGACVRVPVVPKPAPKPAVIPALVPPPGSPAGAVAPRIPTGGGRGD